MSIESRDDSIPLPVEPQRIPGQLADTVGSPASGDPFFLGFAAGAYYPPEGEVVDPELVKLVQRIPATRVGGETCAFVMFSKRMTRERFDALESMGARVLGRHPHYAVKVALPPSAIDAVAAFDFVRWIGVPRSWQKIHPNLSHRLASAAPDEQIDVCVSLFESDLTSSAVRVAVGSASEISPVIGPQPILPSALPERTVRSGGWREADLMAAGLDLRSYSDAVMGFRATVRARDVAAISSFDFVQFLELEGTPELTHEESMPMVNADLTRVTDSGGTFGNVRVGLVDSGLEIGHHAFSDLWGVGWDLTGSSSGPWGDVWGHGSHVGGTFFGNPPAGYQENAGVVPGANFDGFHRLYNAKYFDDNGDWGGAPLQDVFDVLHTDYLGQPYPRIVNNSWGTQTQNPAIGSEMPCRELDAEAYFYKQLYVFASGNDGPSFATIRMEPSSKNVFTVGSLYTHNINGALGEVYYDSSRGPCGDGRWKPNISAPGVSILSVDASTTDGYSLKTGTSHATPHVSGIATQLADRWTFLRDHPYALSAVLMATAMTKDNTQLSTPSAQHLDEYGAGRVEAYKALNKGAQALYFWAYQAHPTSHVELDFEVLDGATRLAVVMTYHELPASAGASKALNDNVDMRLDRAPFTGSGNTGDYVAQVSGINNTEIRVLDDPGTGDWKVKLWPESVADNSGFRPWVGVCVAVSYGDTTPNADFTLNADKLYAAPGETVTFDATVMNPTYIGSNVMLEMTPTVGFDLTASQRLLADGALADLTDNPTSGRDVLIGSLGVQKTREQQWQGNWTDEGPKVFQVELLSENVDYEVASVDVIVDGTPPSEPTNVDSPTNQVGESYCGTQSVTMTWDAATDAVAGVDGYSVSWSNAPDSDPGVSVDTSTLSWTQSVPASSQAWYFHIRAIDKAGLAGSVVHFGPLYFGDSQVTNYCNSNLNSTGQMGLLDTVGVPCLGTNSLTLRTTQLPANVFGYYLFSDEKGNVPFFGGSQGVLCLGAPIIRFANDILSSGSNGQMQFSPDLTDLPQNTVISPGSTWNFQLWYRDGQQSNTSNGIEIIFD